MASFDNRENILRTTGDRVGTDLQDRDGEVENGFKVANEFSTVLKGT